MGRMIEITDINNPLLDEYARLSEVELLRYREPGRGIFVAESPNVIQRALQAGYEPVSFLVEKKESGSPVLEVIRMYPEVPVYVAELSVLSKLTGYPMTRGMLCIMNRKVLPTVEEICGRAKRIVVLERVMNPTNVGAIIRSAAALGMDAVVLTAGSCDPLYRRSARVSMGTVFQIPWTFFSEEENGDYIERLQSIGFKTVAMALREDTVELDDPKLLTEERLAIILGTEGEGLSDETIAQSDYTVCIPMAHGVDSLNVAAASAVAFWQLGRRR